MTDRLLLAERRNCIEEGKLLKRKKYFDKERRKSASVVAQKARTVKVEMSQLHVHTGASRQAVPARLRDDRLLRQSEYFRYGPRLSEERLQSWHLKELQLQRFLAERPPPRPEDAGGDGRDAQSLQLLSSGSDGSDDSDDGEAERTKPDAEPPSGVSGTTPATPSTTSRQREHARPATAERSRAAALACGPGAATSAGGDTAAAFDWRASSAADVIKSIVRQYVSQVTRPIGRTTRRRPASSGHLPRPRRQTADGDESAAEPGSRSQPQSRSSSPLPPQSRSSSPLPSQAPPRQRGSEAAVSITPVAAPCRRSRSADSRPRAPPTTPVGLQSAVRPLCTVVEKPGEADAASTTPVTVASCPSPSADAAAARRPQPLAKSALRGALLRTPSEPSSAPPGGADGERISSMRPAVLGDEVTQLAQSGPQPVANDGERNADGGAFYEQQPLDNVVEAEAVQQQPPSPPPVLLVAEASAVGGEAAATSVAPSLGKRGLAKWKDISKRVMFAHDVLNSSVAAEANGAQEPSVGEAGESAEAEAAGGSGVAAESRARPATLNLFSVVKSALKAEALGSSPALGGGGNADDAIERKQPPTGSAVRRREPALIGLADGGASVKNRRSSVAMSASARKREIERMASERASDRRSIVSGERQRRLDSKLSLLASIMAFMKGSDGEAQGDA